MREGFPGGGCLRPRRAKAFWGRDRLGPQAGERTGRMVPGAMVPGAGHTGGGPSGGACRPGLELAVRRPGVGPQARAERTPAVPGRPGRFPRDLRSSPPCSAPVCAAHAPPPAPGDPRLCASRARRRRRRSSLRLGPPQFPPRTPTPVCPSALPKVVNTGLA